MLRKQDADLTFAAVAVNGGTSRPRYIVKSRVTGIPSSAGCLYAAHLAGVYESPNTIEGALKGLRALLSFAWACDHDLEGCLLRGERIEPKLIRAFAHWLEKRYCQADGIMPQASRRTFNAILLQARIAEAWFIMMYWTADDRLMRGYEIQNVLATQKAAWAHVAKRVKEKPIAPDMDEEDIRRIDGFLVNAAVASNAESMWVRAFLIWRLAIEFGMRIGEILALRVEDCPNRHRPTFEIVRMEDRDHVDPRGTYAPRPKTLGRSLGILLANSAFPELVLRYISEYRITWKTKPDGSKRKSPHVQHPYLLVNDDGAPLPHVTARSLASRIAKETGVPFHWHLARHAFFNRAYAAIGGIQGVAEQNVRINDLVYWGGWSSPKSLDIYTNRARKHRAAHALAIWQGQQEEWTSLR